MLVTREMAKLFGVVALVIVPAVLLSQAGERSPSAANERLITDSPWAKPVTARVKGEDGEDRDPRPSLPDDSRLGRDLPTGGSPARADRSSTPESFARPVSVVRWDSAAPVREACAKAGLEPYAFSCYSTIMFVSGQAEKFESLAKQFYILTVSNYPEAVLSKRDRAAPQHSSEANAALDRLGERLRAKTRLRLKSKADFAPQKVLVLPAGKVLLAVFFFSRSASITAEEGSIGFESTVEPVEIRSKFNLKKMIFNGKLEL